MERGILVIFYFCLYMDRRPGPVTGTADTVEKAGGQADTSA